jgi:hypothetical protein
MTRSMTRAASSSSAQQPSSSTAGSRGGGPPVHPPAQKRYAGKPVDEDCEATAAIATAQNKKARIDPNIEKNGCYQDNGNWVCRKCGQKFPKAHNTHIYQHLEKHEISCSKETQ